MNENEKRETMETFKELPLTQREKECLLVGLKAGIQLATGKPAEEQQRPA